MKTVMKKLLSVALAAILLVSAVPFQASATSTGNSVNANVTINITGDKTGTVSKTITVTDMADVNLDQSTLMGLIPTDDDYEYSFVSWSDTAGQNQSSASPMLQYSYLLGHTDYLLTLNVTAKAHDWKETSNTATCTADGVKTYICQNSGCGRTKTENVTALGHDWTDWTVSGDNITRSCKRNCGATETKSAIVTFVNKLNNTTTTAKVGDTYALPSLPFVSGYRAVGWAINGEYKSGNLTLTDDMSGQTFYAYYENTQVTDSNTVKVYLKLRVGSEDAGYSTKQTIELDSFDLLSTDNLLDALKSRSANYDTTVKNCYSAYTWNGVFYNNNGNVVATDNATNADGTKSVFIRADRKQADVIVHVYNDNTKTEYKQYTLNYQAPGEAVNIASIKQLLSDNKVSYSTVKMYTYEGWKNFKNGKSNTSTNDITVSTDNSATHIYVYLTKGTSKADSTNPKTGDMIFIPAMVMLASAAAVAYIYMGTKKRATR